MRRKRSYSIKWAAYREAVSLMEVGDVLLWDVPNLHVAKNYAWTEARERGWLVATESFIVAPDGRSGRIRIARHQ